MADGKLALARSLGAEIIMDARTPDAAEQIVKSGGAQGVLATAVSTPAFAQGLAHRASQGHGKPHAVRRFPDADLRCRLKRITIRGSIAGNRKNLAEALECRGGLSAIPYPQGSAERYQ